MVLIFSTTTSLLAEEYVESFPAERLAVTLFKIAKETGVELSKENKSFLIRGNWSNVIHAHTELQLYLAREIDSDYCSNEASGYMNESSVLPPDVNDKIKKKTHIPRGRKPGTTVAASRFSQGNLPEPVVVHYGKFTSKSISTGKSLHRRSSKIKSETNSNRKSYDVTESHDGVQAKGNDMLPEDDKKITGLDICSKTSQDDNLEPAHTEPEPVIVKIEPVNDKEDFDGDTDVDELYLHDNKIENNCTIGDGHDVLDSIKEEKVFTSAPKKKIKIKSKKARKKEKKKIKEKKPIKLKTNEPNSDGEFSCEKCEYKGKKKSNLSEHVRRMHGDPLSCGICEKVFGLRKDLARHRKQVHTDPSHFCEICGKLYKFRRAYNDHMQIHKDDYVKPNFPCEICGKTFSTKYVLTGHVNSAHLGMKKSFVCPTCGRSFTQKNSYLMHANVHAGIKPFVCDVCGKAFSYDKSLKEHKYMHDTERRFKCSVCNKAFRQKASLQIHAKTHKETRDYICQSCGKGFTQKQALHRHERIHSGDKPFKCALCSRTFNDYSIIRRHMIMLHKRDQKDPNNWKHDIISTVKHNSDFYIEGGTGYNSTERVASEIPAGKILEGIDNTITSNSENSELKDQQNLSKNQISAAKQLYFEGKTTTDNESDQNAKELHLYSNTSDNLHQLSRAVFVNEKDLKNESDGPSLHPINYSVHADLSESVRTSTDSDETLARYQTVAGAYPTGMGSSNLLISNLQPAAVEGMTDESRQPPVTDSGHAPTLPVQWPYSSYSYYNPATFQPYQGPSSHQ